MQRRQHFGHPDIEAALVVGSQRVLVLRGALAPAHGDVLHRLQEQPGARHVAQGFADLGDDLVRAGLALTQGLERDKHLPGVHRTASAARAADKTADRFHVGVEQDFAVDRQKVLLHGAIRDALRGHDAAVQAPGVFLREKALGHPHVQHPGQDDHQHRDQPHQQGVVDHPAEGAVVEAMKTRVRRRLRVLGGCRGT